MRIKISFLSCIFSLIFCFSVLPINSITSIVETEEQFDYTNIVENVVADEATMLSSYESDLKSYDNFLQAYYDSLTYNFGQNYKGSCGYVAIAMLLSYYDTYLNDSIIPEQYDVPSSGYDTNIVGRHNSPGVLKDTIIDPNGSNRFNYNYAINLDNHDYLSYIDSISNQSLHAKLITIGAANGFFKYDDPDNLPCGTSYSNRIKIISDYFSNVVNFGTGNQYYLESEELDRSHGNNTIRNFVISKIKSGQPVLVGISDKYGSNAHACIAYDYNADLNKIYCHMGWGANSTHYAVEDKGFSRFNSALVINFKLPHNHPKNYRILTNNASFKEYCYCSDDIVAIHNHPFTYKSNNSTSHTKSCVCGKSEVENHVWIAYDKPILSSLGIDENFMVNPLAAGGTIGDVKVQCKYCKYIKILGNEFIPIPASILKNNSK